jgi:hypothetical protein
MSTAAWTYGLAAKCILTISLSFKSSGIFRRVDWYLVTDMSETLACLSSGYCPTLKMKAVRLFERLVTIYRYIRGSGRKMQKCRMCVHTLHCMLLPNVFFNLSTYTEELFVSVQNLVLG